MTYPSQFGAWPLAAAFAFLAKAQPFHLPTQGWVSSGAKDLNNPLHRFSFVFSQPFPDRRSDLSLIAHYPHLSAALGGNER